MTGKEVSLDVEWQDSLDGAEKIAQRIPTQGAETGHVINAELSPLRLNWEQNTGFLSRLCICKWREVLHEEGGQRTEATLLLSQTMAPPFPRQRAAMFSRVVKSLSHALGAPVLPDISWRLRNFRSWSRPTSLGYLPSQTLLPQIYIFLTKNTFTRFLTRKTNHQKIINVYRIVLREIVCNFQLI